MSLPEQWLGSPLRPRRTPLCPEIELWLLGDEVDLAQRVNDVLAVDSAPYWAFCWGSGQALARYLLDRPELVRGRTVADFGTGCGIAAIAALKAGAREVVAVDIDRHARLSAERNAALNQVALTTASALPAHYDVLLASDVLYELGNLELLSAQAALGRTVLVSDPLRSAAPRLPYPPACSYEARTVPDVDYPLARAVVYLLSPHPRA